MSGLRRPHLSMAPFAALERRLRRERSVRRAIQVRSGTQLPWKPNGTRCRGSEITATGSPVKLGAEDDDIARVSRRVVDVRITQPSSSAASPSRGRTPPRGYATRAELVHLAGTPFEVVLQQWAVLEARSERSGVAVPVLAADETLVVARKLLAPIVDDLLVDAVPTRKSIVQRTNAGAPSFGPDRSLSNIFRCRITSHTTPTVRQVVRVHRVVHVAEIDLAPACGMATRRCAVWQQADPCAVIGVPRIGEGPGSRHRGVEVERDREDP